MCQLKDPKKRGAGCERGCDAGFFFESIRATGFADVLYEEGNVVGVLVRPQDYKPQRETPEVNVSVLLPGRLRGSLERHGDAAQLKFTSPSALSASWSSPRFFGFPVQFEARVDEQPKRINNGYPFLFQ